MSDIRPELSKKNRYYITKHRYYELKHFCLQYDEFKKEYGYLLADSVPSVNYENEIGASDTSDKTSEIAMKLSDISDKIELIEHCATATDECLADYILDCVTKGHSFTYLSMQKNIPCGKDTFYDRYRKFFFMLHELKK